MRPCSFHLRGKDGEGGQITADYDAASFREALDAEEDAAAIYRDSPSAPPAPDREESARPSNPVKMPDPAEDGRNGLHFAAIWERSGKVWWRDQHNVRVFALQPVALALIVVLTQWLHEENAVEFIDFFLTVSALWIGMSLCIRDFVSERRLYALDELSGLHPVAYFQAKLAFAAALSAAGVFILCLVAHLAVWAAYVWTKHESSAPAAQLTQAQFTIWHFMPRFIILGITGISGTLIGLFLSLVARTERAAITLMPLALLPQVVFSRYACGFGARPDGEETFPFHALLQWESASDGYSSLDWINYFASLPMTTRHASWSLESLNLDGFVWSRFYWPDFGALSLLVAVQCALVYLGFALTAKHSLSRIR